MDYEQRWYQCEVKEPSQEPPDFELVPAAKREEVRRRWESSRQNEPLRCSMWGPQIDWFRDVLGYEITVVE